MNDKISLEYSSDGKNVTPMNMGLPESKHIEETHWQTPYQIASKVKRETVPVAFRIDEVAYANLDLLATHYGITLSSLVNEILNSYIEEHHVFAGLYATVVNLHLERLQSKMLKMDENQLFESAKPFYYGNTPTYIYVNSLGYGFQGTTKHKRASIGQLTVSGEEEEMVLVPTDMGKYNIVSVIMAEYDRKVEQYNNGHNNEIKDMQKIVDIINGNSGKDLINALIEELKHNNTLVLI